MPTERVQYLVQQYFSNACTSEEMEELATWVNASDHDAPLKVLLENAWEQHTPLAAMPEEMSQRIVAGMFSEGRKPAGLHFIKWAAAAAAVILITAGSWWLMHQVQTTPQLVEKTTINPASNGAVLTLADGRTLVLDSIRNGLVAVQGNTSVNINNGRLVYDAGEAAVTIGYNTMTTPKGRQYQILLPDGTRVWLNAASSITYPTAFTDKERIISITGEAYFEVAKNAAQPFKVKINDNNMVEVLGTSFNVNAYKDDGTVRTTLIEGKVKVAEKVLQPGEQAIAASGMPVGVDQSPNLGQVMAWKNGSFNFNDMDLPAMMKEIERWYDVTVTFQGPIPQKKFGGEIPRNIPLQQLLDLIRFSDVEMEITGRRISIINRAN